MRITENNRYYINNLNPPMRFMAWFIVIFFGMGIGQVASLAVLKFFFGYTVEDLQNMELILGNAAAVRAMAFANQLFTFMLPGVFLAFILFKEKWMAFLGLKTDPDFPQNKQPDLKTFLLAALIIFSSWPLTQLLYLINTELPLPDILVNMEDSTNSLIQTMLDINGPLELILMLIIVALTPAIGEELVFRGLLQNIFQYNKVNIHLSVLLSAIIFSAIHLQFQGFLPRFFLGMILGYFLAYGGSLWLAIFAHFLFNGSQVLASYVVGEEMNLEGSPDWADFNAITAAIGTAVFVLAALQFKRMTSSSEEDI